MKHASLWDGFPDRFGIVNFHVVSNMTFAQFQ